MACGKEQPKEVEVYTWDQAVSNAVDAWQKFPKAADTLRINIPVHSFKNADSTWSVEYSGQRADTLYKDAEYLGGKIEPVPFPKDWAGYFFYLRNVYKPSIPE